jgi:hypothetical protein
MGNAGRWSVRRALLARDRCTLVNSDRLPAGVNAMCTRAGDGTEMIIVRPGLDRSTWREAVGHELVHLERGPLIDTLARHPSAGTWAAVVAREEEAVHREVACRLIPADQLVDWLRGRDGVTAADIAGEFEVPVSVAAVRTLRGHPPRPPWPAPAR